MKRAALTLGLTLGLTAFCGCSNDLKSSSSQIQMSARVEGEHEIGNGGGLGEKLVLEAYRSLNKYLDICFTSSSCEMTQDERRLLGEIYLGMAKERKTEHQIRFLSEKAAPGFFLIDGQVRVAKTGNDIGSLIYVNTDLLYSRNSWGQVATISLPMAVAILVHELGHHHGIRDHAALDVLASKVQGVMQKVSVTTKASTRINGEYVFLEAEYYQLSNTGYTLTVNDGFSLIDVSGVLGALMCPDSKFSDLIEVRTMVFPSYDYEEYQNNKKVIRMALDVYARPNCDSHPAVNGDIPPVKAVRIPFYYDLLTKQISL